MNTITIIRPESVSELGPSPILEAVQFQSQANESENSQSQIKETDDEDPTPGLCFISLFFFLVIYCWVLMYSFCGFIFLLLF